MQQEDTNNINGLTPAEEANVAKPPSPQPCLVSASMFHHPQPQHLQNTQQISQPRLITHGEGENEEEDSAGAGQEDDQSESFNIGGSNEGNPNSNRPSDLLINTFIGNNSGGFGIGKPNPRLSDIAPRRSEVYEEDSVIQRVITATRGNDSFTSIERLPYRGEGVRRSCILIDTPGHFARAQDITIDDSRSERGKSTNRLKAGGELDKSEGEENAGKDDSEAIFPKADLNIFAQSMADGDADTSGLTFQGRVSQMLGKSSFKKQLVEADFTTAPENQISSKSDLLFIHNKNKNIKNLIGGATDKKAIQSLDDADDGGAQCVQNVFDTQEHIRSEQDSEDFENQETPKEGEVTKISSLKDLLAVFGVTLKNEGFSHKGRKYQVDLEKGVRLGDIQILPQSDADFGTPLRNANMSAFFAGQDFSVANHQNSGYQDAIQDLRGTFGNINEHIRIQLAFQQSQQQPQNHLLAILNEGRQQSQTLGNNQQFEQSMMAATDDFQNTFANQYDGLARQETGELVDIDMLVLSSPTHHKQEAASAQATQVYQPSFEREASQKEVKLIDKEVQCEIIDARAQTSPSLHKDNSIFSNFGLPNLRSDFSSLSQVNYQVPNNTLTTQDDYYKGISEVLARQINQDEDKIMEAIYGRNDDQMHANISTSALLLNKPQKSQVPTMHHQFHPDISGHSLKPSSFNQGLVCSSLSLKRTVSLGEDHIAFRKNMVEAKNIDKLKSENEKLIEELQKANSQIQSKFFLGAGGRFDGRLHLAFLFATPLVVKRGVPLNAKSAALKDLYKIQPLLQFAKEFQNIKSSLTETKRHVKIMSQQATINSLSKILSQNPVALHFTGHGLERKSLLLEAEDGEGVELNEVELRDIIAKSNANIEFVFVASCFSEFAGKVFFNAGAKHVICVKQGNTIDDGAVLSFSRAFYFNLVSQNQTVCQAYQIAKNMVQAEYGPTEAQKFSIFTHKETYPEGVRPQANPKPVTAKPKRAKNSKMPVIDDDDEFNIDLPEPIHTCKVFGPFDHGKIEILDTKAKFNEFPTAVENFIGRQIEIFEVVHAVCNHRLVNIIGLPGIGKTALAKNAVNYIAQRRMFKHGIIFFSLKGYKQTDVFVKKLVSGVVATSLDFDKEKAMKFVKADSADMVKMMIAYFKENDEELLVVFDNAEELLYHDKKGFKNLVTQLIHNCTQITFLITSRLTLGVLQDIQEKIIVLSELSPVSSVDLFFSRSREVSEEEKIELIKYQPKEQMLVSDSAHTHNTQTTNLARHHLFKILSGNPHAIILAVPHLIKRTLKELYELLNSEQLHQVLQEDGVQDSTVASLCLSIELSIMMLQEEDHDSLSLFFLVGLLPGGIFREELQHIWKKSGEKTDCDNCVKTLMDLSLIQIKEQAGDKSGESKLTLPPFINSYAEQTIDPNLKHDFQQNLCRYYAKVLREIYREDYYEWEAKRKGTPEGSSPSQFSNGNSNLGNNGSSTINGSDKDSQLEQEYIQEMRSKLIRHETNIWACIYRLSKSDKPIQIPEIEINLTSRPAKAKERRYSVMTPTHKKRPIVNIRQRKQSSGDPELDRPQDKNLLYPKQVISEEDSVMKDSHSNFSNSFNELSAHQRNKSRIEVNPFEFDSIAQLIKEREEEKSSVDEAQANDADERSMHSSEFEAEYDGLDDMKELGEMHGIQIAVNNPQVKRMDQLPQLEPAAQPEPPTQENHKLERSPSTLLASVKEGGNKLINVIQNSIINKIVRNSFVVFKPQRASVLRRPSNAQALKKVQTSVHEHADSDDDMYLPKKFNSIADMLPSFQLGPTPSAPDNLGRQMCSLSEAEKLIVYYGMNLYLLKDDESALKIFEKYSADIKGSALFEANISRLLGLIYLRNGDLTEAMSQFQDALKFYNSVKSLYGLALCKFAFGVIKMASNCRDEAMTNFEQALRLFQQSNHIMGQARCLEHLAEIYGEQGIDELKVENLLLSQHFYREFDRYRKNYKKSCLHVPRFYGGDISLLSEVVLNNENRDLFPDVKSPINHTVKSFPRREKSTISHISNLSDSVEPSRLNHQMSAPSQFMLPLKGNTVAQSIKNSSFFGLGQNFIGNLSSSLGQVEKMGSSFTASSQQSDPGYFGEYDEFTRDEIRLAKEQIPPGPAGKLMKSLSPTKYTNPHPLSLQPTSSAPPKVFQGRVPLEVVQEEDYKMHEQDLTLAKNNSNFSSPSDNPRDAKASPQSLAFALHGLIPKSPNSSTSNKSLRIKQLRSESTNNLPPSSPKPTLEGFPSSGGKTPPPELSIDTANSSQHLKMSHQGSSGLKSPMRLMESGIGFGKSLIEKLKNLKSNSRKNSMDDQ